MAATIHDVAYKWFDYIIIGGGTAGLTLAARLTEDSERSVLVLEAGPENLGDPAILRPASFGSHFDNDKYTWDHRTIKQVSLNDRQALWFRGKGLGGSSAINFLCWSKPPRNDIDDLERLGNPGWNWTNYEHYVQKTEGFIEPDKNVQLELSMNCDAWKIGRNGPLTLAYPSTIGQGDMGVRQTMLNAGVPIAPSPYSGDPCGFYFALNTLDPKTHSRTYATTAFYSPNSECPNLSVLVSAYARRVLTAETGNNALSALGVEFKYAGKIYYVNAREEVVLCAGSLKTPQLLELSGIGRREVLDKINIPTKLELPGVGENVQEHMYLGLTFELEEDVDWITLDIHRDPELLAKHLALHASGTGLFTTGIVGLTFLPLDMITSPERAAEIYSMGQKAIKGMIEEGASQARIEQYKILLQRLEPGGDGRSPGCEIIVFPGPIPGGMPNAPEDGKRYISISVAMNYLFSRGTIHSVSVDPSKDPEYDPRYFSQMIDLEMVLDMVKFVRSLAETAPLKDMISKELNPGLEIQSDEQLRRWIRGGVCSTFHTAGPCSMLPRDKGGVVDHHLKVYGTNNLRVVDLSVVPLHFAAHSQATVHAIAEQAADIIKGKLEA